MISQDDSSDGEFMAEDKRKFAKWKGHSTDVRNALKIASQWSPWTDAGCKRRLRRVPQTARALDLLNVAWGARLMANQGMLEADLVLGFYVDLSQGIERRPWGGLSVFATGLTVVEIVGFYVFTLPCGSPISAPRGRVSVT